jgi:hypothetical protein
VQVSAYDADFAMDWRQSDDIVIYDDPPTTRAELNSL